jgi:peptidoglycan/xylan/chitin deacetylase (PgdA/CDA1 family)
MPPADQPALDPLPRLTVALTFDHDSISDGVRRGDPPVKMSHAEFGVRVGARRILELLASRGIRSTWFVPGHTLETFPNSTAAILAGGHARRMRLVHPMHLCDEVTLGPDRICTKYVIK